MILRAAVTMLGLGASSLPVSAADLELLMFEQPGCVHCLRWTEEIGRAYPNTDEGRAAPLHRVALRGPLPEGVQIKARPVFTPTFILLSDGVETGRIEGYPGEDFFWPLLAALIAAAPED